MLSIHPLVLGTGHRLFADGFAPTTFHLVDTTPVCPARCKPSLSGASRGPNGASNPSARRPSAQRASTV
jgi:hypothetical protein